MVECGSKLVRLVELCLRSFFFFSRIHDDRVDGAS
jgi:hypothetical protein